MQKEMKLGGIGSKNPDAQTDKKYQLLRNVLESSHDPKSQPTIESIPSVHEEHHYQPYDDISKVTKTSSQYIPLNTMQSAKLRENVHIPMNCRLVESKSGERQQRAKSQKYRAISIDEKGKESGKTVSPNTFQKMIQRRQEDGTIVYEYCCDLKMDEQKRQQEGMAGYNNQFENQQQHQQYEGGRNNDKGGQQGFEQSTALIYSKSHGHLPGLAPGGGSHQQQQQIHPSEQQTGEVYYTNSNNQQQQSFHQQGHHHEASHPHHQNAIQSNVPLSTETRFVSLGPNSGSTVRPQQHKNKKANGMVSTLVDPREVHIQSQGQRQQVVPQRVIIQQRQQSFDGSINPIQTYREGHIQRETLVYNDGGYESDKIEEYLADQQRQSVEQQRKIQELRVQEERLSQERREREKEDLNKIQQLRVEHQKLEEDRLSREKDQKQRIQELRQRYKQLQKERLQREEIEREKIEQLRLDSQNFRKDKFQRKITEQQWEEGQRILYLRIQQQRIEGERQQQLKIQQLKLQEQRLENQRIERQRLQRESIERQQVQYQRIQSERTYRSQLEEQQMNRLKLEYERLQRIRNEMELIEERRIEQLRMQEQRILQQKLEREKAEQLRIQEIKKQEERLEVQRVEREKIDQERIEQLNSRHAELERQKVQREKIEQERIQKLKLESEKLEIQRVERKKREEKQFEEQREENKRHRQQREQMDAQEERKIQELKTKQQEFESERAQKSKAEIKKIEDLKIQEQHLQQQRNERQKTEYERIQRLRIEEQRITREKSEKQRIELQRIQQIKSEEDRLERERLMREQNQHQMLEQQRIKRTRIEEQKRLQLQREAQIKKEQEAFRLMQQQRIENQRKEREAREMYELQMQRQRDEQRQQMEMERRIQQEREVEMERQRKMEIQERQQRFREEETRRYEEERQFIHHQNEYRNAQSQQIFQQQRYSQEQKNLQRPTVSMGPNTMSSSVRGHGKNEGYVSDLSRLAHNDNGGDNIPHSPRNQNFSQHQQNDHRQNMSPQSHVVYETGRIVPHHQEMGYNPNQEYYVHSGETLPIGPGNTGASSAIRLKSPKGSGRISKIGSKINTNDRGDGKVSYLSDLKDPHQQSEGGAVRNISTSEYRTESNNLINMNQNVPNSQQYHAGYANEQRQVQGYWAGDIHPQNQDSPAFFEDQDRGKYAQMGSSANISLGGSGARNRNNGVSYYEGGKGFPNLSSTKDVVSRAKASEDLQQLHGQSSPNGQNNNIQEVESRLIIGGPVKNIKKKPDNINLYSSGGQQGQVAASQHVSLSQGLQERQRHLSEYQEDGGAGYDFGYANSEEKSRLKEKKEKDQQKYNLFSVADEQVNTKCKMGVCTPNEICASKPKQNAWKKD